MKRILFVDDEPAVLDGLRRMLRPLRDDWDLHFASSGVAAIACLQREHFDVIVTDMRMPVVDGVMLLTQVMHDHPDVIRIVLSGQTELEQTIRTVPVAHQFLAKPCSADVLKQTIVRIGRMQDRLKDQKLRMIIGEIDRLPVLPSVCKELAAVLARTNFSACDVAVLVEKDSALCAKILQLVNSSFFGLGRRLSSAQEAVSYLGTSMIKNLVTSVTLFRSLEGADPKVLDRLQQIQAHDQAVGALARSMFARDKARAEEASVVGLLSDVGQTVLAVFMADRYRLVTEQAAQHGILLHEAENDLDGITHADIGAFLLETWGLPFSVLEAVAFHHRAPELGHTRLEPVDAVFIADALLKGSGSAPCAGLDPAYLDRLGVTDLIPQWLKRIEGSPACQS